MRNKFNRKLAVALLVSSALAIPAALATEFIVDTPTVVTNGDATNVVDGNDTLSTMQS